MPASGRTGAWVGLLTALATAAPVAAKETHVWRTYTNPRFGYSMCWPSDVVTPEPPPNHDRGQSFAAADGGHIAVWATPDIAHRPIPEVAREDEHRLSGREGSINRSIVRRDFYIITGQVDDTLFWNRTVLKDGVFTTVEIRYPLRNKARWDEIVADIGECLVPG